MAEWHPLPAPAAGAENGQASREADRTEEIYRQLDRICASRAFRGSLRLTRFLRFTVETALVGKSDTIKAYTIAVEALGRDANFDPQSDPIVRVEAGRLRQALARYYAGAGRNDPVLIEFPRGTYVPSFQRTAAGGAPPTKANDSLFSGSAAPEKSADKTVHSRPSDRNALDLFGLAQQLNHNVGVAFDRATAQSQQFASVASAMESARRTLRESRRLLQASADSRLADGTIAPPISDPWPDSSDAPILPGGDGGDRGEPVLTQEEQSQKLQTPSARSRKGDIASAIERKHAGRAFRVAFCAVAVVAILEVLFGIDQPMTGGQNKGLFLKLWPLHGATATQFPTLTGQPIIFVEPVKAFGDQPPDLASPGMIRERLFDALTRFDEVTVVPNPPHETSGLPSASESGPDSNAQPSYYRLSSTISYYPQDTFTLTVRLIDTADDTVAWAKSFDRLPEPGRQKGHISSDVARTLFQPFGLIQAREAIKRAGTDRMRDPYSCILDANVYLRSLDPSLYGPARRCLERATADSPPLVGVFVKLARLYCRDYQIGANGQPGNRATLDRAYRMAVRAIDIKPNSAAAQFAMAEVLLARGDVEQAKIAEDNALRLNPYDNAVIYGHASLLILTGKIDEGLAALRENTNKKTVVWTSHHFLVALGSYLKGDLTAAEMETSQIDNANFPPGLMLDAIIAANNKDGPRARHDIALLYAKNPSWRNDPRANISYFLPDHDMASRIGDDFTAVVDDLKKRADVVGSVQPAERP